MAWSAYFPDMSLATDEKIGKKKHEELYIEKRIENLVKTFKELLKFPDVKC